MKFAIFVIDDESRSGSPQEMDAINQFNEMLRKNGHWIMAAGLESPRNALLVDYRNNADKTQHGSLFNEKEFYSGMWIIEAADLEIGSSLAAEASNACNRRVELRPFL